MNWSGLTHGGALTAQAAESWVQRPSLLIMWSIILVSFSRASEPYPKNWRWLSFSNAWMDGDLPDQSCPSLRTILRDLQCPPCGGFPALNAGCSCMGGGGSGLTPPPEANTPQSDASELERASGRMTPTRLFLRWSCAPVWEERARARWLFKAG